MPSAFDSNAQDVGLSLDTIEDEIRQGLVLHADRLVDAFNNGEYYAQRGIAFVPRRESEDWIDFVKRPKRTLALVFKAVETLSEGLYSNPPTRRLKGNAGADAFLQQVYEVNHVNSLMQEADAQATLNGFCGVQAHATGRPEKPVKLYAWGAHELVVWTWPDDPTEPWAVLTITRQRRSEGSQFEQRLEYNVWSRDEHRVYQTKWLAVPREYDYAQAQYRSCFGRPAYYVPFMSGEPAGSGKNPYGVLPFSFVHNKLIVSDFYAGGIGTALRQCNAEVDRELSDLAQHARECMDPDRFMQGVSATWRREKRAGQWQLLTPGKDAEGEAADPKPQLIQPALNVELIWLNTQNYINQSLQSIGVPLVAYLDDASTDLSGIAVVAKHIPLLQRVKKRQPLFTLAENDLARLILAVAGMAYPETRLGQQEEMLEVLWPVPRFPLPTPERDTQDAWEMNEGIKSLVNVVAEREGCTLEAAWEVIERVAQDNKRLATILQPSPTQQQMADEKAKQEAQKTPPASAEPDEDDQQQDPENDE